LAAAYTQRSHQPHPLVPPQFAALVATPIAHHQGAATRAERSISYVIRILEELRDAGTSVVVLHAGRPLTADSRCCDKQRQLRSGQEAQLKPAKKVIRDEFGIASCSLPVQPDGSNRV
jgi:hypothetical protein